MTPQRLDLVFTILWRSRWHVGSGSDSAAADRLLRRYGGRDGPPFVPGSQIKGVLRHQCERLTLALGGLAVDPHAASAAQQQDLVRHFQPLACSELLVDRLFGSRYQGECLFVDNALPAGRGPRTSLRTRTALDRVTGTVQERHLFTTELAELDSPVLRGRLRARHPAGVLTVDEGGFPYEYALLVAALLSLEALGGGKSSGLGRCQIDIEDEQLICNGQPLPVQQALAGFTALEADWFQWLAEVRREEAEA